MSLSKHDIETRPDKPDLMPPNLDGIPRTLHKFTHWVWWKYTWSHKHKKWNKTPKTDARIPGGTHLAPGSSTDPATWMPWEEAGLEIALRQEMGHGNSLGIGFVLTASDPIVCIDLDKCRDKVTGEITEEALAIVQRFNTYTQVSTSGTGLHLFLFGKKPGDRCKNVQRKIEVYEEKRFVAMTGQLLPGCPADLQERQGELEAFYDELFPPQETSRMNNPDSPDSPRPQPLPLDLDDEEVIRRASFSSRFARLWAGNTSDYDNDRSSADFALALILCFWVGQDAARIRSLMERSGLRRDKWNREDYLPRTIARAMARQHHCAGDKSLSGGRTGPCPHHQPGGCSHSSGGCSGGCSETCPRHSKEEDKVENGADSVLAQAIEAAATAAPAPFSVSEALASCVVTLDGLAEPPEAHACQRGGSNLLGHVETPGRYRAVRHACDCWHCSVCRRRLAYKWAAHLASVITRVAQAGQRLYTLECGGPKFDKSIRRALHRREALWAALEVAPGLLLVVYTMPDGCDPLPGSTFRLASELGPMLVDWALKVRTWPEAISPKKTHPVRTCKNWNLPPAERTGQWRVVTGLSIRNPEHVLEILRAEGVIPRAVNWPDGDQSLTWLVEWVATSPEQAQRVLEALKSYGDRPLVATGGAEVPDIPLPW